MDIRKKLYSLFYENLISVKSHPKVRLDPDVPNSIVCPQCFLLINQSQIYDNEIFSLEHVPPEALGGKIETFTCKNCNNWSGHYLESHLSHSLDMANFVEGLPGSSVDGIVTFSSDTKVNAELTYIDENYLYIKPDQSRSIPGSVKQSFESIESDAPDITLRTHGKRGKVIRTRRAEAALLRIAYLSLFAKFGYSFLLYPGAKVVRSQFKYPEEEILPTWGIFSDPFIQEHQPGIYIIKKPADLRSIMVVCELSYSIKTRNYGVLVPGPTEPHINIYDYLLSKRKKKEPIKISANKIKVEESFLTDPNSAFAFFDIWKHFLSIGSP
jgi:hypothetical protein